MSTKLRLSSDEQFWVMCQVKHGLRTVDEALDFLRKEHSRDGCEVTEVEIDYDTSYPTCEVPQFTEEIVLERVKSRTRNFFRHFSRQWTVRHSNAFNEQPVSPKARTRPQSLFFVQSPKIEEEWEKGDELLDLLITEGKLTNDDKRDLQLKFSDNYKTGDAQRMILGNLVKSGRITIDDAMHYSRILGIIATAEKEAHDIAEANSAFATKKVYNFGIYKYYRHRPCQRRILQIDFQACFICNIQKGNLNRKFNFSEVLDYESEEGLRFFINFTDHHEYEMEADSPEDKEKICRLLQMIVEQNRSHEKGRALTIHDRATTLPRVQAVLKEGLLEKKNHNLYTTWTKRWVRIRQGELSYYKPDEDKHTALNILQLAHDITSVKKAGDSAVSIATRKKMYLFRIPSNSQLSAKEIIKARDEWIRALKYACGDRWMDSEPFNDAYNRAVNAARDQVHGVKNQDHIRSTVKDFQKELETLNAVLSIMNVKGDAKVAMDKLQNMAISIETMMKAKENNETSNVITTQRDNTEKTEEEIYDTNSVTESSYTTVDVDFRQNQVNNASQSIGREKFPTSAAAMVQFENNDADDNRASMKSAPEAERGLSEMAGPSTSGFSEKLYDHGGSIRNSIMSSEPEYADDVYLQARNDDSATESARPSTPSSPIEPDSERSNTHSVPPPPPLPPPDLLEHEHQGNSNIIREGSVQERVSAFEEKDGKPISRKGLTRTPARRNKSPGGTPVGKQIIKATVSSESTNSFSPRPFNSMSNKAPIHHIQAPSNSRSLSNLSSASRLSSAVSGGSKANKGQPPKRSLPPIPLSSDKLVHSSASELSPPKTDNKQENKSDTKSFGQQLRSVYLNKFRGKNRTATKKAQILMAENEYEDPPPPLPPRSSRIFDQPQMRRPTSGCSSGSMYSGGGGVSSGHLSGASVVGTPPPPLPDNGAVPPPPPPPPPAVAYALEHKFTVKSNVKMRPFHWNKTPVPMVCTSVWKDTRDVTCKLDLVKLEAIFGSQDGKVQTVVQNTVKKKIKTLLDPKLAQNLGIFLSGFKIDLNDLKNRLVILYECDGGLSPEHISALRRFQPTTEDKEMYKSYDGNPTELEATDRFMILMCGIPNLRIRLDLLSTVNEFPVQYEDLAPTIGNVIEACKELYSNQRFIAVLEYILATGNFVNSTTGKGQALGFRLSALTKLTDCRSKDKNYTLLKFIVEQMYQQEPDLLNIMDDLLPITKVPDASIKALQAEAEIMKKDLCKIRKNASILLNHEEASEEDANFCAQINSFVEHYDAKMATLSSKSEEMGTAYTLVLTRFGESLNTDSEELFSGVNAFIKDFQKEVDLLVAADAAALHSATKFQLSQSMKTDTFSESEECSTLERSSSVSSMESQTIFRSPSGTPTHVQELRKAFGEKARKEAGMSTFEKELRRVNKKEKPKTKKESSSKNGAKKSNKKPTKEGYMEKLSSGRNQTWNKRYFELAQTGHLHYSKKKNDRSVESIYLRDCPCTVEGEDERIIVLETEERVYKFRAPSKTESVNWMTGILAYTGRK
ncbi:formin-like protein 6 isoform X1 [Anneissia japonica]|uniref:formin-like protein 6 isoform X1 n=1 Tax=Anneissia japonica TaxID=1529436 RepID=UPI0014257915|nr:formin-like protein 6 isoform X1 [Anneissia japonica]